MRSRTRVRFRRTVEPYPSGRVRTGVGSGQARRRCPAELGGLQRNRNPCYGDPWGCGGAEANAANVSADSRAPKCLCKKNAMNFRVALVVPDKRLPCQPRSIKYWNEHCRYDDLEAACHDDQIDLVVLPEQYYEDVSCDEMEEWAIGEWYDHLKVPVLMGFRSEEGFQIAIYVNPKSSRSETRLHRYVKHSSAERLAFEWPGYAGGSDAMFDPIVLGDARIGIQICHDMFYGLLGHRLRHRGANLHINLSGQDVNRRKWVQRTRWSLLGTERSFPVHNGEA